MYDRACPCEHDVPLKYKDTPPRLYCPGCGKEGPQVSANVDPAKALNEANKLWNEMRDKENKDL